MHEGQSARPFRRILTSQVIASGHGLIKLQTISPNARYSFVTFGGVSRTKRKYDTRILTLTLPKVIQDKPESLSFGGERRKIKVSNGRNKRLTADDLTQHTRGRKRIVRWRKVFYVSAFANRVCS